MKVFFLILFALLLSGSAMCQVSDTLLYDSNRKLTWADFKGKPRPSDRSKGAQITVTINLKVRKVNFWTGKAKYDAYALAFTNQSWVKNEYKDAYSLSHEQLHFDIAHIYAETLELVLNNLKSLAEQKAQVAEALRKSTRSMSDYQALYDRETRGGNNVAKQKEWAKKIEVDLKVIN